MDEDFSYGALLGKFNSRRRSEGFKRPGFMQIVKMDSNDVTSEIDRNQLIMTPNN